MGLPRYLVKDAYTLEELRRQYGSSDPKGRTLLLQALYKDDGIPPYEIALMAVEDPHVEVRQWIARHGRHLDDYSNWAQAYSERLLVEGKTDREFPEDLFGRRILFPDRNLVDRLKSDPDPFVRACLRENPDASYRGSLRAFEEATPLERLALVRNREVDDDLIQRIFDPEDQQLGIDMAARGELVCAFLSNAEFLEEKLTRAGLSGHPPDTDGYSWFLAKKFLTTLWELASKWPKETLIPRIVHRHLPSPDKIKAQTYRSC